MAVTLEQAADPDDETLAVTDAFRLDVSAALHAVAAALLSYGQPDTDAEAVAKRDVVAEATAHVRRLQTRVTVHQQPDAASMLAEGALITELDLVMRELNRTPLYA